MHWGAGRAGSVRLGQRRTVWMVWVAWEDKRPRGLTAREGTWGHMVEGPVAESQHAVSYSALGHTGVSYWILIMEDKVWTLLLWREEKHLLSNYCMPALLGDFICTVYYMHAFWNKVLLSPFYKWRDRGLKRLSGLPKVSVVLGRSQVWTWVCLASQRWFPTSHLPFTSQLIRGDFSSLLPLTFCLFSTPVEVSSPDPPRISFHWALSTLSALETSQDLGISLTLDILLQPGQNPRTLWLSLTFITSQ